MATCTGNLVTVGGFNTCPLPTTSPTTFFLVNCWISTNIFLIYEDFPSVNDKKFKSVYLTLSTNINMESNTISRTEHNHQHEYSETEEDGDFNEEDIILEKTLAIVKPDAFEKEYEILDVILRKGFFVLNKMKIQMSPEQASEFYEEHYNKSFFSNLVHFMSSGPIIVLVLGKQNAVKDWRELIGPTNSIKARETHPKSLRAIYGTDGEKNAFHGSDGPISSKREIKFFFPNSVEEPIPLDEEARYYMQRNINPTLVKGLAALCHSKPRDPVTWLADWLTNNNPNKPKIQQTNSSR